MVLHPHGPIEVAIQKSFNPEMPAPTSTKLFWYGALTAVVACVVIYWAVSASKAKKEKSIKENQ